MSGRKTGWTDERIEQLMGNLLRAGVIASALVVLAGGVLYLVRYGADPADHRSFHGEPADLRSPGLIQLGVLLLIATPVLRVAFPVFAFARQRDYTYVALTLFVLAVLVCSLFGEL